MKSLLLLGSTGSIGTQTLELVRASRDRFRVEGLAAHRSWEALLEQAREFAPRVVAVTHDEAADRIEGELPAGTALLRGPQAVERLADEADYDLALHGIVGAAGLASSVRVLERGRALALANKESLVMAGALLMELARRRGAPILPVDSEHCAIFQCLQGEDVDRVRRVWLTASGGALRDRPLAQLAAATPDDALRHPNWDMGRRITIDSATLMNKALEVIETHHLYGLEAERIGVVLHRQSVVHSMVELVDGSVMAQMGPPDMRGPIHYALHHPERVPADLVGFDPVLFRELTFEQPDPERFPALGLGYDCLELGGDAGCVLNAADEIAVQAFLDREIGFRDVERVVRGVIRGGPASATGTAPCAPAGTVEALLAVDRAARERARAAVADLAAIGTR